MARALVLDSGKRSPFRSERCCALTFDFPPRWRMIIRPMRQASAVSVAKRRAFAASTDHHRGRHSGSGRSGTDTFRIWEDKMSTTEERDIARKRDERDAERKASYEKAARR